MKKPKKILITGATGAIGRALSLSYSAPGVELVLHGRNIAELEETQSQCQAKGANTELFLMDLVDTDALLARLQQLEAAGYPDLVIANAGMNINHGTDNSGEDWQQINQLIDLNIKSTMALANFSATVMKQRGYGQIALVSSLAAFYGLPVTPSYSASKAAVKAYGEGMRGWLAPHGVEVNVIMPGYVKSTMCEEMPGPKPFLWTPDRAAKHIKWRLARNHARISFPFPLNIGCWGLGVLLPELSQWILKTLNYTR